MARTWRPVEPGFSAAINERYIAYRFRAGQYSVALSEQTNLSAPVEAIIGGNRHGFSFLARVSSIGDVKLDRAPLVETRYLREGHGAGLVLSPGFPAETPGSFETALGRVLSPQFEEKCRRCHGAPGLSMQSEAGVRCEHCHGPGSEHLRAIPKAIMNPARLANAERIAQCGACHSDGRRLADPMPEDLLISNQADALVRSECFVQSGGALTCSTCHDPHRDSPSGDGRYVSACLSCHNAQDSQHAAVCPIDAKQGCIGCHMPAMPKGSFRMVDHWIRAIGGRGRPPAVRTAVPAKQLFLRVIAVEDSADAEAIRAQILNGASFFELARTRSIDPSSVRGGWIGPVRREEAHPAARTLAPGDITPALQSGAGYVLIQRLPRDFRSQANELFQEASELKAHGQLSTALERNQRALEIYPVFLRALLLLGITLGEQGNTTRGLAILEHAANLYPDDPGAQFNLGVAYGAAGRTEDEIRAYERALVGEPDLVNAYLNLGAAHLSAGRLPSAIETWRKGISVNPLSAALYRNLAGALTQSGDPAGARKAMQMANAIVGRLSKPPQGAARPR